MRGIQIVGISLMMLGAILLMSDVFLGEAVSLEDQLQQAVKDERFEDAAMLRDRMRRGR